MRRIGFTIILVSICVMFLDFTPATAGEDFEFLVMGDSRSEPWLPYGQDQEGRIQDILKHRYRPKSVDLTFYPDGRFMTAVVNKKHGEKYQLDYLGQGFPQEILKYDPDTSVWRTICLGYERDAIFAKTVEAASRIQNPMVIHTGDVILNGYQGIGADESPFWREFREKVVSKVEALGGEVLMAVGNHETWDDEAIEGMVETFPGLERYGFTAENRIYSLERKGCLFVFLDSGPYCPDTEGGYGSDWCSFYPDYEAQMDYLRGELDRAKTEGVKNVFVVIHKPSFVQMGHDPLPEGLNPHEVLREYAGDMTLTVFNGHCHTTAHYYKDGVRYLVLGGAGAPQTFTRTDNPSTDELYWKGAKRELEYSYLQINVENDEASGILYRRRPGMMPEEVRMF